MSLEFLDHWRVSVCSYLQVGVHELGIRRAILQEVENFLNATKIGEGSEVR